MRRINGIIESAFPPPTNMLWLDKGSAKYYHNGQWVDIAKAANPENPEASIPTFVFGDNATNKQVAADLGIYDVVSVRIEGILNGSQYDAVGYYHGGSIVILKGTVNTVFDVNFNTGELTQTAEYDVSRLLPCTHLEVGTTDEVKSYNLEMIGTQTNFFIDIEYAYGVGSFQSATGGMIHVVTSNGGDLFYDILPDGSIIVDRDYIKTNLPYQKIIEDSLIGSPIEDDVTNSQIVAAGQLLVKGSTGVITYTRTPDSTDDAVYFICPKKDGTSLVLTYTVANKTITSAQI
jgi:hypothetical protein